MEIDTSQHNIALNSFNSDEFRHIVDWVRSSGDPIRIVKIFRKSIAVACEAQREKAIDESIIRLDEIVVSLEELEEKVIAQDINSTTFIEDAMWLCLEGVVIVMSNGIGLHTMTQDDYEKLNAVVGYVLEYFKFKIYDNKLQKVSEVLEYQNMLDSKIADELNAYVDGLNKELERFDSLVNRAFSEETATSFKASEKLAEIEGVNKEDILRSIEDVDAFFK